MQLPQQASKFWRILKYLLIGSASLFIAFILTVWVVFEKKNDWLLHEIQAYVNESQSGQLEIQSMELSLIRSFPGVTIVLQDIQLFKQPDSLRTEDEKPILRADKFFARLKLIPLLNEQVEVSDVTVAGASLNLETNKAGELNLLRALSPPPKTRPILNKTVPPVSPKKTTPSPKQKRKPKSLNTQPAQSSVYIDLQHLEILDVNIKFHGYRAPDSSVVHINQLEADLQREDSLLTASILLDQVINQLYINQTTIKPGQLTIETSLQYNQTSQLLNIQSTLNLEEFEATIEGTYEHQKNGYLNLSLDASANDLQLLSLILNPEVVKRNKDQLKQGDIYLKGSIVGEVRDQLPQVDISVGARNLSWQSINKNVVFENIGFDARFRSGKASDFSQAEFELKNLKGELPGGSIHGYFSLLDLVNPHIKYDLKANADLNGYDEVFNFKNVRNVSGEVSLKAKYEGPLNLIATHQMDSSRSSSINVKALSFLLLRTNQQVSGLTFEMKTRNNQSVIQPCSFQYGQNKVNATATVDNLLYFLLKGSGFSASGKINAPQLFTKDFLFDSLSQAQVQDRVSNLSFDFKVNTQSDSSAIRPSLAFTIQNLNAKLDKLSDINKLNAQGVWKFTQEGLKLDLQNFHAVFPQGTVDVIGNLLVQNRTQWTFQADAKLNKFPWTYIRELTAEIQEDREPASKNLSVTEMDVLTGNFRTSASIISYPFDITALELEGSKIQYQLPGSKPLLADKLTLSLEQLLFKHPTNSGSMTGLQSTTGNLKISTLIIPGLKMNELQASISGQDDQLTFGISAKTPKSNQEQGDLTINFSEKEPALHLKYEVKNANAKYFVHEFVKRKLVEGDIDYKLDLSAAGKTWSAIKQSTTGKIEISGSSLYFYGLDIDKALRKYERSQNFNLTDIGAVVIAGPVGLAVTKGSEFVSLAAISTDSTKQTHITNLYARWDLNHLKLTTEDVAFATTQNRIAFDGQIDFSTNTVPGLTIAVVDKKGCSLMDQKLSGNFGSLKTGKLNITKTLLGSVINFVNAIVGTDCKPIYNGRVPVPEK